MMNQLIPFYKPNKNSEEREGDGLDHSTNQTMHADAVRTQPSHGCAGLVCNRNNDRGPVLTHSSAFLHCTCVCSGSTS
jgi:hypothetical protein